MQTAGTLALVLAMTDECRQFSMMIYGTMVGNLLERVFGLSLFLLGLCFGV